MSNQERNRVKECNEGAIWKKFGPYLSERQWGTVREDYSEYGSAWDFFTHDQARSRAYRWGEDGIAGISDDQQLICFAPAFWNGKDAILKERLFGLTGKEGNHSEDVKEHYYYAENTPSHSYMKYVYKYPIDEFPYSQLVSENATRNEHQSEFEIENTGVFDQNHFFEISIEYAKVSPEDLHIKITVENCSDQKAAIVVLPTIWFRNTWTWGEAVARPILHQKGQNISIKHPLVGEYLFTIDGKYTALFTENETNAQRLYGLDSKEKYVKDAFHDYIIDGKKGSINPDQHGTKAAFHCQLEIDPKSSQTLMLRLVQSNQKQKIDATELFNSRKSEASLFYDKLFDTKTDIEKEIFKQSLSSMLWGKQYYNFDLNRWLEGDIGQFPPPEVRKSGRNSSWKHLKCHDIISMPDKWEYPWFAAWDSAFHCISLAHVDAEFAKEQLLLFLSDRYMHESGQIPAYEWAFGDVNPPVISLGILRVFEIDKAATGQSDLSFLQTSYPLLKKNYRWWMETQRKTEKYLFGGGFLGLDNIGVLDRGAPLGDGEWIEQVDGTCWMALFSLHMIRIALEISNDEHNLESEAVEYAENFLQITLEINHSSDGLWQEQEGVFADTICDKHGNRTPMPIKNIESLMVLYPVEFFTREELTKHPVFSSKITELVAKKTSYIYFDQQHNLVFKPLDDQKFGRIFNDLLNPNEFFSPYGIRSLSKQYEENPYHFNFKGREYVLQYKPAESITTSFGENSNWRGPVWFPVNYVIASSLEKWAQISEDTRIENAHLQLIENLTSIFSDSSQKYKDLYLFYEYFNPETGAGCGASHQTGWTGLIADLLLKKNLTIVSK